MLGSDAELNLYRMVVFSMGVIGQKKVRVRISPTRLHPDPSPLENTTIR